MRVSPRDDPRAAAGPCRSNPHTAWPAPARLAETPSPVLPRPTTAIFIARPAIGKRTDGGRLYAGNGHPGIGEEPEDAEENAEHEASRHPAEIDRRGGRRLLGGND